METVSIKASKFNTNNSLNLQAGDLLPLASPNLHNLRRLSLLYGKLGNFPMSVASALGELTFLELGCNELLRIPPAVSQITTLVNLHLGGNYGLQLSRSDVALLRPLPDLEVLEVSRLLEFGDEESGFSQDSVGALLCIGYTFPGLYLAGFDNGEDSDSD